MMRILLKLTGQTIADDINLGDEAFLEFNEGGKITGRTGCNSLGSSFTQNKNELKFGLSMGILMACPPDLMQIETAMQKVLAQATNFEIVDAILILERPTRSPLAWLSQ